MDDIRTSIPPPPPPLPAPSPIRLDVDPPAAGNIVTALLKSPRTVSARIAGEHDLPRSVGALLGAAVLCHAIFGLAMGMFGGAAVAAMDAVKAPLVAIGALALCFPSLYVFACVAGSPLSLGQALMLGASCLAMVGLLLIGLAPVAWLFAVSTESLPFVVALAVLIWIVSVTFAARYVGKLAAHPLFQRQAGIRVWFAIFTLVTLQMVTCMRPMLAKPEAGWWTADKKCFLAHFASTFEEKK